MNIKNLIVWFLLYSSFSDCLPPLGLGTTNILSGGPIRPTPGHYYLQFFGTYHANSYFDFQGKEIPLYPEINTFGIAFEYVYQGAQETLFKGKPGFDITVPIVLASKVDCNPLGIKSSGAGFANLGVGVYLQWDTIMRGERPIFAHRLEFGFVPPTGKTRVPCATINPGTNYCFINPEWSGTLYFTPSWAVSWDFNYFWAQRDKKTHIKSGDAIILNYSFEHALVKRFWVAINGYFLRQLRDDKFFNQSIPHSREQVVALGPGMAYFSQPHDLVLLSYFYIEFHARNRSQGTRFIFRFVKHF